MWFRIVLVLQIAIVTSSVTACGNRGPLYIPKKESPPADILLEQETQGEQATERQKKEET